MTQGQARPASWRLRSGQEALTLVLLAAVLTVLVVLLPALVAALPADDLEAGLLHVLDLQSVELLIKDLRRPVGSRYSCQQQQPHQ